MFYLFIFFPALCFIFQRAIGMSILLGALCLHNVFFDYCVCLRRRQLSETNTTSHVHVSQHWQQLIKPESHFSSLFAPKLAFGLCSFHDGLQLEKLQHPLFMYCCLACVSSSMDLKKTHCCLETLLCFFVFLQSYILIVLSWWSEMVKNHEITAFTLKMFPRDWNEVVNTWHLVKSRSLHLPSVL